MNTKKKFRKISYLGFDSAFFEELEEYYSELIKDQKDVENIIKKFDITDNSWASEFLEDCNEQVPHLIYIDFGNIVKESKENGGDEDSALKDNFIEMLLVFRKHNKLNKIPIVGLFVSKEELQKYRFLYLCGMVYGYIKRESSDNTIFQDTAYIALDDKINFEKYAEASKLSLKYHISFLAALRSLNYEYVTLESDLKLHPEQKAPVIFNLFEDFKAENFEVFDIYENFSFYDFEYRFMFKIPYSDPWNTEDNKDNILYQDTVETWFDSNRKNFCQKSTDVLIIDKEVSTINDITGLINQTDFSINFRSFLKSPFDTLRGLRPSIIIANLDTVLDEEVERNSPDQGSVNDINMLFQLVDYIKQIDNYIPFIVVFNCPSKTEALHKAFNYSSLLAHPEDLNYQVVEKLLALYQIKESVQKKERNDFFLRPTDGRIFSEIKEEVIITGLTEHELTFLSMQDFPYYSVIKLDVPVDIYLTIVPETRKLKREGNYYHYMGFIQGVDEGELSLIRRFVNQLIFNRPDEFRYLEGDELEQEGEVESKDDVDKKKMVKTLETVKPPDNIERYEVKKETFDKKKSKL